MPALSRKLEPRAAIAGQAARGACGNLAEAGVPAYASIAPVIPAITDHEIEAILPAAARRGCAAPGWILLRLPHEVAPLFREWLQVHFPDRAEKVMGIVRAMRGGKRQPAAIISPRFRPKGLGPTCSATASGSHGKRAGIPTTRFELDCSQFQAAGARRTDGLV